MSALALNRIEHSLLNAALLWKEKVAIVDGDHEYSYEHLGADALKFAEYAQMRGVQPDSLVAVFMDKSYHAIVTFYGLWLAGAVVVPLFEGLKTKQIQYILIQSGSQFVVSTATKMRTIRPEAFGRLLVMLAEDFRHSLGLSLKLGPSHVAGVRDPACIFHTSGSTAKPKGVAFSHDNLIAGTRIVKNYLGLMESDILLSVLPLSFDYGLNQLLTSVEAGMTLVLNKSPFPTDIFDLLRRRRVTGLAGVPLFWINLCRNEEPSLLNLRFLTNSGGHLPRSVVKRLAGIFPRADIFLMYGLTEAFRSTYLDPGELWKRPDSIGRAIPESEILIVSQQGTVCRPGEVGELVHSGPTVSLGYWRDPAATARRFRPHPLRPLSREKVVYSGDLARYDEDGFIYFVGRNDEMVKVQGQRISPLEVETALYESALLSELIVLAKENDDSETDLVVHCVPRDPETFSTELLLQYCRQELPSYMIPRKIYVRGELPRTSTGKIDRAEVAKF